MGLSEKVMRNAKSSSASKTRRKTNKLIINERAFKKIQYEFLSSISHQLRTPIATVQSSLELLEMYIRTNNPARQNQTMNKIKRNLAGLNETLERITSLYKYNIIDQKLKSVKIDPHKFTSELLEEVLVQSDSSHLLNVNIDAKVKYIRADEFVLKQIMLNLVFNAIKYSPEGSQVLIQVKSDNQNVAISVKDEGTGINKSDMKNLYMPFFRGKNSASVPGVGLGLAIVKKLSSLHKIKIVCLSEPDNGTEFILKIPIEVKK